MTFNTKITIDLEVEVDGEIPKGLDLRGAIQTCIDEFVPSVVYSEDDVLNLFSRSWSVKVGRIRWNREGQAE